MEQLFTQAIALMSSVPSPVVYLIAAAWIGLESAGIGLPIEPMMLFIGSLVAQGSLNIGLAIAAVTLGCLAFSALAYIIGKRAGTVAIAKVGRYVGLNQARAQHLELWLQHRGGLGVFIARETPMVRTYSSFVMGAANVPLFTFTLGTLLGSFLYATVWIVLGNILGQNYRAPLEYLDRFGTGGVVIVVAVVVVILVVHHFWGRLSLRRIAAHFHRHHPAPAPTPPTTPTQATA